MWFLESNLREKLEKITASGFVPTAEHKLEFNNIRSAANVSSINSKTAIITIQGVLTPQPDLISMLFGGGNTTYSDINDALIEAASDNSVDAIKLLIDSPGGDVSGLFTTLDTLNSINKPITSEISNMAASAAYAIASQTDSIIATNRGARVGSVGVVASIYVGDDYVDVTSTNAPAKRPDPSTTDGKALIVKELDSIENLFVEYIANGRNTSSDNVKENFGRGAVLLADDAKSRNMIDGIADVSAVNNSNNLGVKSMDLQELKTEHQNAFAEAKANGVEQERDRVVSHLIMGEASGDMKTAIESIKDGSDMTSSLNAKYLAASMNKTSAEDRADDNPEEIETPAEDGVNVAEMVMQAIEKEVAHV